MIYQEVNFSAFCDSFRGYNGSEQFSYEAKKALFEHYDELGEDVELDIISICCDWTELTPDEALKEYGYDELDELVQYIEDNTYLIKLSNENLLFLSF